MAPFPPSSSISGQGTLIITHHPQTNSTISRITFQYPLKLVSPPSRPSQRSSLVFLLTYGGGLVSNDFIHLSILLQAAAKLALVTQGHTKIFKSSSRDIVTRQYLDVTIEADAAVCLLPDPVQPFAESVYDQRQVFTVLKGGSLCVLDWVTAGRSARGEEWDLMVWKGRNEVWGVDEGGRRNLLLRDNVLLENPQGTGMKTLKESMYGHGISGTLILHGPHLKHLADFFVDEFTGLPRIGSRDFRSQDTKDEDEKIKKNPREIWRASRLEGERKDDLLWSAAKVRGCTVIKFGAKSVEGGRTWIGSMIKEEASVRSVFGEEALMCVR